MCLDSLYGAYLKRHYPFEFYTAMLKLYTKKKNKEKIAAIISEMRRYKNIRLVPSCFGQDNSNWYVDKENNTISQSISSLKYMSQVAADELRAMGEMKFDTFTDALRYMQMNTCLNTRQTEILIRTNYFRPFGKSKKLFDIYNEYYNGKASLKNKSLKSADARLEKLRAYELLATDEALPIQDTLLAESEFMEMCISSDPSAPEDIYLIEEVDDKYGVKVKMYSVQRGISGQIKLNKKIYEINRIQPGQFIKVEDWCKRPTYIFKNGKRTKDASHQETWLESYKVL